VPPQEHSAVHGLDQEGKSCACDPHALPCRLTVVPRLPLALWMRWCCFLVIAALSIVTIVLVSHRSVVVILSLSLAAL